jgi:hypothetical protein
MPIGFLRPKCYAVIAYPPKGTSMSKANLALNDFIGDKKIGLPLYHDHFVGVPGGFAIVYVESADSYENLRRNNALKGWNVKVHPLTFTGNPVEMLYQIDFTMTVYRGRRLKWLSDSYKGSQYEARLDERKR